MKRTDTIIIGAGQAGLAMSHALTSRGVDHVILERGRVAQRWSERWDSLRLLTPNWMTRLPGWTYRGSDAHGFMSRDGVIDFLSGYAKSFDAPVREETTVLEVSPYYDGWRVVTDDGTWSASNVVIATGHCDTTAVPAVSRDLPSRVMQIPVSSYRNPDQIPSGTVLVVGASSSGVQLARELRLAGREVVIAVGRHTRLPRRYRKNDILLWLDRMGSLRRDISTLSDPGRARSETSLQLSGNSSADNVDLYELSRMGVRLAGRLDSVAGNEVRFAGDLKESTTRADVQLRAVLSRIDQFIHRYELDPFLPDGDRPIPVPVEGELGSLNLVGAGVTSVLWATGYKRSYPWLAAPVFDAEGEIIHERGVTPAAGLYVIGLQFLMRRNSSFIDGVGDDAQEIATSITERDASGRRAA